MSGKRLNTRLEAEGAEFLVLGQVLIANIECYKAYTNYPGYDLVATNSPTGRIARIQVKSRWATNRAGFFSISNLDCDFVVHVALNMGERRAGETLSRKRGDTDYYVFPREIVAEYRTPSHKLNIRNVPDLESYRDAWSLIVSYLEA